MDVSRRYFFFGSALAGAVPAFGFGTTPNLKMAGYKSPNEKLNFAAIGSGGQGASNLQAAAPTENIVALCDVDDKRAAPSFDRYPKATRHRDFRKMLDAEAKNIDAVIVATPDHMHATAAMWCMERQKHVYVQKPLVRTIWEARQLREAAAKYKVATQMGNQGYSNEGTRQCAEMVWNGDIGSVTEVHAWSDRPLWPQGLTEIPAPDPVPSTLDWDLWLGVAEARPYTAGGKTEPDRWGGYFYQPFNWRGFYDFGCGALGDMACHILGAPNMALHLSKRKIVGVECVKKDGPSPFMFPKASVIRYDFAPYGDMPALKIFWYDGLKENPKIDGVPEGEWIPFGEEHPRKQSFLAVYVPDDVLWSLEESVPAEDWKEILDHGPIRAQYAARMLSFFETNARQLTFNRPTTAGIYLAPWTETKPRQIIFHRIILWHAK